MSLTFKLFSLGIRTLAKPIGNYIKRQAKEHDGFRRFAINQAQRVHRFDMRMRLGILHDPAAQERMHERERKAAEEKKKKEETPTVRTEKEQQEYERKKERDEKADKDGTTKKKEDSKVKIRPLSDARAIELGANFFSEAFIFGVAVSLLLLENWRSRNKEANRRDEVAERFDALEAEVERLRKEHNLPELEALNEKIRGAKEQRDKYGWYNPAGWWRRFASTEDDNDDIPTDVITQNNEAIPKSIPADTKAETNSIPPETKPAVPGPSKENPPGKGGGQTVEASTKGR